MKTLKKTLCLVLAVVMAVGVLVIPANADFADEADIEHKEAAAVMNSLEILEGVDDEGHFDPDGILKRAQAAKIIASLKLGKAEADDYVASDAPFTDVADYQDGWAVNYVAYCADNGIIGGNGDGTFTPDQELTGHAFAKMLLCALGYDGEKEGFGGNGWEKKVEALARKVGLNSGITSFSYTAPLSRDKAAQMAYNALFVPQITGYEGGTDITLPGDVTISSGATRQTGGTLADEKNIVLRGDGVKDEDGNSVPLLDDDAEDVYGRPNAYEVTINGKGVYVEPEDALLQITAKSTSGYTAKGKVAYGYALSEDGATITEDGADVTTTYTSKTLDDVLNGEVTGASTVYLYGSKKVVDKVVVINTYADIVTKVNAAKSDGTKASIDLQTNKTLNTDDVTGYDKDDVVVYTRYTSDDGATYAIGDHYKAEAIVGTMTSYTNSGSFKINDETMKLAAIDALVSGYTLTGAAAIGTEQTYYVNNAHQILYSTVKSTSSVPTNFAYIVDTLVTPITSWPATNVEYEAQVQAVLSDGTLDVFDLDLNKDKVEIIGTDGKAKTVETLTERSTDISDLEGNVYAYELNGSTIALTELGALSGSESESGAYTVKGNVTRGISTKVNNKDVIQNNNTIYVSYVAGKNPVVRTGYTSIKTDETLTGATVVTNVTVSGSSQVNVATVIFVGAPFKEDEPEIDPNSYVYVTGDYTTELDDNSDPVYVYDIYNTDGEKTTAVGEKAGITVGIYQLNTDGEIEEDNVVAGKNVTAKVTNVIDNVAEIGGKMYDITDAVVVDTTGKDITEVAKDQNVILICKLDSKGDETDVVAIVFVSKELKAG